MKYAVVNLSGKQRRLVEGKTYKADRFDQPITEVLLFVDGDNIQIGQPFLANVGVSIVEAEDIKDKKVTIRRYEAKSGHHRSRGHRQPITTFKVEKIGESVKSSLNFKT